MLSKLKYTFRSLFYRNYALFFTGQGISLIGTWMQRTTMGWYVYRVTHSIFLLGLMGFLSQIPSVFLSLFAGVWADRYNRRIILIMTQIAFYFQAIVLAYLVKINYITANVIWPLIILSLIQGIIDAIDAPVRQSFVLDLVETRELLPNAIALNSAMFNGARLIGPSLAGLLIIIADESLCFYINAISYIAVIITLYYIKPKIHFKVKTTDVHMFENIAQGWKYAFNSPPIRYLIFNISVFTMFAMSYTTLLPVFARDILHGDSRTLGLLMSTAGVGALIGAMYLASRKNTRGLGKVIIFGGFALSITLIILAISRNIYFSIFLMLIVGLTMMSQMAFSNTILQTIIEPSKRGRVLSLYTMAFGSVLPIGNLVIGSIASKIGAPQTLILGASVCILWSFYGLKNLPSFLRNTHRMYIRNKIVPIEL